MSDQSLRLMKIEAGRIRSMERMHLLIRLRYLRDMYYLNNEQKSGREIDHLVMGLMLHIKRKTTRNQRGATKPVEVPGFSFRYPDAQDEK